MTGRVRSVPRVACLERVEDDVQAGLELTRFLSNPNADDLALLASWVEDGSMRPVVERTYALSETVEALGNIASGRSRGKVVVSVA